MKRPESWTMGQVDSAAEADASIWCDPAVADRVRARFTKNPVTEYPHTPTGTPDLLIAVGGGTLLDAAKVHRLRRAPEASLVAIPSIWGSGAEASAIVVEERDGRKIPSVDPAHMPDARAVWYDLAESIPPRQARHACGDVWAHALEAFLSPVADEALRDDLARTLKALLDTPWSPAPIWFELSAAAIVGPNRAGVGIAHGIAHTIEARLRSDGGPAPTGHAALTSTFLLPAYRLTASRAPAKLDLLRAAGIDPDRLEQLLVEVFDRDVFDRASGVLRDLWRQVLRDPATRTNPVLVRPGDLDLLLNEAVR